MKVGEKDIIKDMEIDINRLNEIGKLNRRLHELQRDYDRLVRASGGYKTMSVRLVEILMAITKADKNVDIDIDQDDDDPI